MRRTLLGVAYVLAAVVALPLAALGQQRAMAGGCGDCCTPLYRIGMSVGIVFRGWCGCDCRDQSSAEIAGPDAHSISAGFAQSFPADAH